MASEEGDPADPGQPFPAIGLIAEDSADASEVSGERLSVEAVQKLYEIHFRELLAFLTGVLRSGDAAEEVAQATFRRLLEVGHAARTGTIKGWLFKVGFHEAMAFRRRQAVQGRAIQEYTVRREMALCQPSTHDELVLREDAMRLKELLAELPLDQQHVVRQRMYEDKTFAVIADELNVPLGTVLTRMRLAMAKLQKWWKRGSVE